MSLFLPLLGRADSALCPKDDHARPGEDIQRGFLAGGAHQVRGGRPAAGILGQRRRHQRAQRLGHRLDVRFLVQDPEEDRLGRTGAERRLPAHRACHGQAPGEDVGRRPGLPSDLLGRHESR
jgi:hypothetical protein